MNDTKVLKEKKVHLKTVNGTMRQFVLEDEFLSEDDKEKKEMERKYQEKFEEITRLENSLKDLLEISKLRKGVFEKLFTEIQEIRHDSEVKEMEGRFEEKKREFELKKKQVEDEFTRFEYIRKRCEEEKEAAKNKLFEDYHAQNLQIEAENEAKKKEFELTRLMKKIRRKEVVKLKRDEENLRNQLNELGEQMQLHSIYLEQMEGDYKQKKALMISKQRLLKRVRPDNMKDCEEFYCPICGEELGSIASVKCGHIFCEKCFLSLIDLQYCFICQKKMREIAHINHSV